MNREAIRCKLSRDFLVNLDEHVVAALDYRLFRFLFRDTVREAELVEWDLRHEVVKSAVVNFFSLGGHVVLEDFRVGLLRVSEILHMIYDVA